MKCLSFDENNICYDCQGEGRFLNKSLQKVADLIRIPDKEKFIHMVELVSEANKSECYNYTHNNSLFNCFIVKTGVNYLLLIKEKRIKLNKIKH